MTISTAFHFDAFKCACNRITQHNKELSILGISYNTELKRSFKYTCDATTFANVIKNDPKFIKNCEHYVIDTQLVLTFSVDPDLSEIQNIHNEFNEELGCAIDVDGLEFIGTFQKFDTYIINVTYLNSLGGDIVNYDDIITFNEIYNKIRINKYKSVYTHKRSKKKIQIIIYGTDDDLLKLSTAIQKNSFTTKKIKSNKDLNLINPNSDYWDICGLCTFKINDSFNTLIS